ncbi:hypothetical protein PQX77_013575 [Marasmius sp. AFHP31]|nr:hypothetical protein PQX77_013575 [Marasmius sp. AFHP31]
MPSRSSTRDKKRQSASSYKTSLIPWFDDRAGQELIVESPVEEYCSGSCRGRPSPIVGRKLTLGSIKSPASALRSPMGPPANVISLGSCKDSQLAWEDLQGSSMTQTLVDLLSSDPHPTLNDFMTKLSHTMHDRLLHMHCANREFKKKKKLWRLKRSKKASVEGDTKGAEISNFQDPQLSSHKPLDMDSRLDL